MRRSVGGEGEGFGLGFLVDKGFGDCGPVGGKGWSTSVCGAGRVIWGCVCAGRVIWGCVCAGTRPPEGSVCAGRRRAEGFAGTLYKLQKRWRNGRAVEDFSKTKNVCVDCCVGNVASGCGYTRLCGE